jgi:hypothetical protein
MSDQSKGKRETRKEAVGRETENMGCTKAAISCFRKLYPLNQARQA